MKLPPSLISRVQGALLCAALVLLAPAGPARADEAAKDAIKAASTDAMWWGDFAALEKQNAYYRQPGRLAPDASSQLEMFRSGLQVVLANKVDNAEAYLKEMDILTLEWATANPTSALAHILHAKALVVHGWSYRGSGFVKDVPPEAWKDFHAYQRRAAEYLSAHADVALTDSYAHVVLLEIGRGLGWSNKQMVAIADEGLKRNPDDLELYFHALFSLLPKWGGNARVVDDYIKYATEQTRAKYGSGMYARLYSAAAEDQFGHALFEDSHADWDKMKQGYEDMFARYRNSPQRLNRYACMACLAKDRDTLLKLLKQLGTQIDTQQWGPNPERSLESCRRWATEL